MRKIKVLFVTEAHFHPTGYSVYTKEVLSRIHKNPAFEVAELACFVGPECEDLKKSPWKIYPNIPPEDNKEAMAAYNSNMSNKFGEFSLNSVLIDFKPDFVMDIRDIWMCMPKSSKIVSGQGLINIEDIKVADLVLTHTGKFRRVKQVFQNEYDGPMYEIKTPNNISPVVLTENHPVLCIKRTKKGRFLQSSLTWKKPSEMVAGEDWVCYPVEKFRVFELPSNIATLLGYMFALNYKVEGDAIIFDIENISDATVDLLRVNIEDCYGGDIHFIRGKKTLKAHLSVEFINAVLKRKNFTRFNRVSTLHFLSSFIRSRLVNKTIRFKKKELSLQSRIFRCLIKLKVLPKSKSYGLALLDKNSVNNVNKILDLNDDIHHHPRIRRKHAYFHVDSILKRTSKETVYNIEVETDNSFVSGITVHNCEHIDRSPFRHMFDFALMPTVDAEPQNQSWIDVFARTDAIFAYSEFGKEVVLKQNKHINFIDVASPCASDTFTPLDRQQVRKELEIDLGDDIIIFGTVMRNQRRKLFPDLFKAFRMFLDNNPDKNNVYLYCHTGFPDVGWSMPDLLIEHGLSSRVLFTYQCRHCAHVSASLFHDAIKVCHHCNNMSSQLVGVGNRMSDIDLNRVYNTFDAYIQWANSEGFGMPALEAAKAGLPVVAVNYSAMGSIIHNIGGIGINPVGYYKELETGCNRAIPNNEELAAVMYRLVAFPDYRKEIAKSCHDNCIAKYNWDNTAQKWIDYFLSKELKDVQTTWSSPPQIFNPQPLPSNIGDLSPADQVNWLFTNVVGKPELINGPMWNKMVKDLIYGVSFSTTLPGYYYNDFAHPDVEKQYEQFNINKAYSFCCDMRNYINNWEKIRYESQLRR